MLLSIQSKPIQAKLKVLAGSFLTLIVKKKHNIGYSVGSRVLFMSYLVAFNTKLTVFDDKLVIKRSDNAAS